MISMLLAMLFSFQAANLLRNAGFEEGMAGWSAFWSRTADSGTATVDSQLARAGASSLKIVHTGAQDWSVAAERSVPARSGEIFRVAGWVRLEKSETLQLGVVARGSQGRVLEWILGPASTSGTHGWRAISRRFVVPEGCETIQFRITGYGPCTAWVDDLSLSREGSVTTLAGDARPVMLSNRAVAVTIDPRSGAITLREKRAGGRTYTQAPKAQSIVVRGLKKASNTRAAATLWDVANDLTFTADYALHAARPELSVTLTASGPLPDLLAYPHPFRTTPGEWLVVPMNEGILYPVDDAAIEPMHLIAYGGHGISMPWYGQTDLRSGAGIQTILHTPDDARIALQRSPSSALAVSPLWEASRGQFAYARSLTYAVFAQGGYVAQCKRYREEARRKGLLVTLEQKRRANPNVDRLIGAANIWNWDADKVALCKEMKAAGMDHVLWSGGGSPAELKEINALGYLTGRYDIYQDVWPSDAPAFLPREGWPDDLVLLPSGDWMRGWAHHERRPDGSLKVIEGGVICSSRQLARARERIPVELKTHPYLARFIDTTTASPWRECYHPQHPLTRSEDRRHKMELLRYMSRDLRLVTGTETGIDPAVPFMHYFEGMLSLGPYRLPDAGRDMMDYKPPTPEFLKFQVGHRYRVPLWELVYHDCVVSQWYWGDYNNKVPEVWDRRDLFNLLYGTPPMYMFTRATWQKDKARFVESYRRICPTARQVGYSEMLDHAFITPDHAVQRTRFAEGTTVWVNFGETPYRLPDGTLLAPMGSRVTHSAR